MQPIESNRSNWVEEASLQLLSQQVHRVTLFNHQQLGLFHTCSLRCLSIGFKAGSSVDQVDLLGRWGINVSVQVPFVGQKHVAVLSMQVFRCCNSNHTKKCPMQSTQVGEHVVQFIFKCSRALPKSFKTSFFIRISYRFTYI